MGILRETKLLDIVIMLFATTDDILTRWVNGLKVALDLGMLCLKLPLLFIAMVFILVIIIV